MQSPFSPSTLILLASLFSLSFHSPVVVHASTNPDFHPLMSFKALSDTSNKLTKWNATSTNPCTWNGVSCLRNRVSRLVLEDLNLTASFHPLTSLTQLRILSLKRNRFNGPIPNLTTLSALKLLFLSHNQFSGEFPVTVTSLARLYRLDLSHNNLSGEIPATVNRLTHLLTLRVDVNKIHGHIPSITLSHLQDFNVSSNHLSGQIPESLSGFPGSAFSHNPYLCGVPLQKCKAMPALASPLNTRNDTVTTKPENEAVQGSKTREGNGAPKMGAMVLIAIVLGDLMVLALVSLLLYYYYWRNYTKLREGQNESNLKNSKGLESEKVSAYSGQRGVGKGGTEMVFLEGVKRFELEELLRASAEMLGKGALGTAYKAVLDDGTVVAVKRLKDANVGGKREFEQRMEVLGRLRHDNVVSLRAYYFAREEKLLVSDYMPNGTLFCLLHGNRGPGRTPLDWTTRLKIAAGAARGVAFIHSSSNHKLTHGNIKSTNVLVDVAGNARVADFGLSIFASPSNSRSNGYRAPEASDGRRRTQKSDVYSFGVLLMEMLTAKCPSTVDGGALAVAVDLPRWVQSVVREEWTAEVFDLELLRYKDIEEEMVALLQIAMACTATAPDQRPRMSHVVNMIEELRGVQVSSCHDTLIDSVSEYTSVSEDACRGAGGGASSL
ncbi:probable leucine-rich repeat receptor-like protein kinase At1g68400 [Abrus precatorius]|uniref:Probable leucine-rich repeat receptor-like protein kinase At1g68400 n=1 Tax=Abrus precatorius TaxID=3816 RepID=A0A8B8M443_ABRPR|nr:probable leucine-rich repeat receptor-like protein kinase At1g68400 [Abrus precatorius]